MPPPPDRPDPQADQTAPDSTQDEPDALDPVLAALLGAAIGVGNIFAAYLDGAMRNPSAAPQQFGNLIFGFAVTEALGIFSLLIAILIHGLQIVNGSFNSRPSGL